MPTSYRRLQQYAIAISIASIVYNAAEGAVSIGFGAEARSYALIFFGAQSIIEVASAAIVVWRFRTLAKPGEEKQAILDQRLIQFEKRATLTIGGLLLALFLVTEAVSIANIVLHEHPESSTSSLIIAASSLVLMILIWLPKRYLARALDSSSMRAEAICSLSCIQITIVLFIGSLIYRVWKAGWWVNAATSIVLGFFFGWEAVKMIRWALNPDFTGGCCQDCRHVGLEEGQQLELGQQYRDICTCCSEKEVCRQSDTCQCSSDLKDASIEAAIGNQDCCSPITPDGNRCCTRALLRQPGDVDRRRLPTDCSKGSCCASITRPTTVDKCCSPALEVPVKASNVQEVAIKTGYCAGCDTDGKEAQ